MVADYIYTYITDAGSGSCLVIDAYSDEANGSSIRGGAMSDTAEKIAGKLAPVGEEIPKATEALRQHLEPGARLHMPGGARETPHRLRALAAIALVSAQLVSGTAAMAASQSDLTPPTPGAGIEMVAPDPFVLKGIKPSDETTPEGLSQMYRLVEQAVDAQFPEMRGRIAIHDPFADPATESARIEQRLNASGALANMSARRAGGYEGGQAFPQTDSKGAPVCVVMDWAHHPENKQTYDQQSWVVVHEVGHCLDALSHHGARVDKGSDLDHQAYARDLEVVGVTFPTAWQLDHGMSLNELDRDIANRQFSASNYESIIYDVGDALKTLREHYADQTKIEGTYEQHIDFGGLRPAFERSVAIRDAQRGDAVSHQDRLFSELTKRAVYQSAESDSHLEAFLAGNREIPFFREAHDGLKVLTARQQGDAMPEYGKAVFADVERPMPVDQAFAKLWIKLGGAEAEGMGESAIHAASISLMDSIDLRLQSSNAGSAIKFDGESIVSQIKTDPDFAQAVANGTESPIRQLDEFVQRGSSFQLPVGHGIYPTQSSDVMAVRELSATPASMQMTASDEARSNTSETAVRPETGMLDPRDAALEAVAYLRASEVGANSDEVRRLRASGLLLGQFARGEAVTPVALGRALEVLDANSASGGNPFNLTARAALDVASAGRETQASRPRTSTGIRSMEP